MSRRLVMCCIVLVLSGFMAYSQSVFFAFAADDNRIIKGVFIDEVDVGGMTAEEAKEAVDKFAEVLKNKKIS
ncbi:MAG TPA: hypothetical protein PK304_03430, partial [Mobilitalea sp.]|nr:hypothetical protein [Mobilitalea sp.]